MHARPNNTGPRMTLTCLTFMPVAALRAEAEGFGPPAVDEAPGAPRPLAVEVGPLGATMVGAEVPEPMNPPDGEGEVLFFSTSLKLAQAMRVLLA
jgi:hypothetical protein